MFSGLVDGRLSSPFVAAMETLSHPWREPECFPTAEHSFQPLATVPPKVRAAGQG